jgi:hypothetical protein
VLTVLQRLRPLHERLSDLSTPDFHTDRVGYDADAAHADVPPSAADLSSVVSLRVRRLSASSTPGRTSESARRARPITDMPEESGEPGDPGVAIRTRTSAGPGSGVSISSTESTVEASPVSR